MFLKLIRYNKKIICPYCFDAIKLKQCPFRMTFNPNDPSSYELDLVLQETWGINEQSGKILHAKGIKKYSKSIIAPNQSKAMDRVCVKCHMTLPRDIANMKQYIFSVIGTKASGKSNYIAVLIDTLQKTQATSMQLSLEMCDDETMNRYNDTFRNPLFRGKRPVDATDKGSVATPRPMVFRLVMRRKSLFGTKLRVINFSFFDTAGEDLNEEDTLHVHSKYIYRSDGIILLIDPTQSEELRDELKEKYGTDIKAGIVGEEVNTEKIINTVNNLILKGNEWDSNKLIPIPLAVSFSKFDSVKSVLPDTSMYHRSANYSEGFDVAESNMISAEFEARLNKWGYSGLYNTVKTRFKRSGFFGISSFGSPPNEDNMLTSINPHRVADPFFWLLSLYNLIPVKKK